MSAEVFALMQSGASGVSAASLLNNNHVGNGVNVNMELGTSGGNGNGGIEVRGRRCSGNTTGLPANDGEAEIDVNRTAVPLHLLPTFGGSPFGIPGLELLGASAAEYIRNLYAASAARNLQNEFKREGVASTTPLSQLVNSMRQCNQSPNADRVASDSETGYQSPFVPPAFGVNMGNRPSSMQDSAARGFGCSPMLSSPSSNHNHNHQRQATKFHTPSADGKSHQSASQTSPPRRAASTSSTATASATNTANAAAAADVKTFREQFKQLYEASDDPKRREFLDDLFIFMQKRGTPINRIPIMAKSTLDLFELFRLVIGKGGLVEVINKKLWREITKGLNLPSSITSAAFTLRTQYMKFLYPYECERLKLSAPQELQAAIDGNRREGHSGGRNCISSNGAASNCDSPIDRGCSPEHLQLHDESADESEDIAIDEKCDLESNSDELSPNLVGDVAKNNFAETANTLCLPQQVSHLMQAILSSRVANLTSPISNDKNGFSMMSKIAAQSNESAIQALHPHDQASRLKKRTRDGEQTDGEKPAKIAISIEIDGAIYRGELFRE